jgi:XTP/dITP diphosphohydrolase
MEIIFATANTNKLIEAQKVLAPSFKLVLPAELGYTDDIPETCDTIRENAIQKVDFIWKKFHKNCFADDTGLEVDALNGAPGVYSARYAGEPKNPINNVKKLLKELKNIPEPKRTARFRCVVALITDGELNVFEGICEGHITLNPSGIEGFGYDPVFIPLGMKKTMAEITLEEKNAISHRGKAMKQLLCHLSQNHK